MKTWSYKAITEKTEQQIASLLESAAGRPAEEARIYQAWAYGAYMLWDQVTVGWRGNGEGERMKALALKR